MGNSLRHTADRTRCCQHLVAFSHMKWEISPPRPYQPRDHPDKWIISSYILISHAYHSMICTHSFILLSNNDAKQVSNWLQVSHMSLACLFFNLSFFCCCCYFFKYSQTWMRIHMNFRLSASKPVLLPCSDLFKLWYQKLLSWQLCCSASSAFFLLPICIFYHCYNLQ